ncbi:hypothetical protein LJB84_00365 [Bacteroidales bacterium OttesenSCG-928-J19]|nr:hypothetical protein [Bacteroidales bacterium OttesenSCG-928-J19]
MNTKNYLLMIMLVCVGLLQPIISHAQVKIGEEEMPTEGAILDLKKTSTGSDYYLGGLLLPNVEILDLGFIPVSFTNADKMNGGLGYDSTDGVDKNLDLAGTIVYNTVANDNKNVVVGIYMWDGEDWKLLSDGGTMRLEPDPGNFDKDGETKTITIVNPGCTFQGDYTYTVIVGASYASVTPASSSDGQFDLTFDENPNALERKAVVMVSDPCGKSTTFVFTQSENTDNCIAGAPKTLVDTNNDGTLCKGGAVYLWITNIDATYEYIWTKKNIEMGRGTSYIATEAGEYIVYVGAIGCPDGASDVITITASTDSAPAAIRISADNSATICGGNPVTLTAEYTGTATVEWYESGAKVGTGLTYSVTTPGSYFAAINENPCTSKPSNTINVVEKTGSTVVLNANDVLINGTPITTTPTFCADGWLNMEIQNPVAGYVYSWEVNGQPAGSGVTNSYQLPGSISGDVSLSVTATNPGDATSCPATLSSEGTVSPAKPLNAAITGTSYFCSTDPNGTQLNTTPGGTAYTWKNLTTGANYPNDKPSFQATTAGDYKVEIVSQDGCVSETATPFKLSMRGAPLLTWEIQTPIVGNNTTVVYKVKNTGDPATSYLWEVSSTPNNSVTPTIDNQGEIAYITFSSVDDVNAKVMVTAMGHCAKSAPLTLDVTLNDVLPPAPEIADPGTTNYCGGYMFKITNLNGYLPDPVKFNWTITEGIANSTGTPMISGQYNEFCFVPFTANPAQVKATATATVNGKTSNISVERIADGKENVNDSYYLEGQICFDVARTEGGSTCGALSGRYAADFTKTYTYTLKGTPLPTNLANVQWVLDDPDVIVEKMTVTSPTTVTIKFVSGIADRYEGNTTGGKFKISATFLVTDGACQSAYYVESKEITIKDCNCCGAYLNDGVWLNFMCHNLGADYSLDPLTPAKGLHGAKYKYGTKTPAATMAEDQASASISNWTTRTTAGTAPWLTVNNPCPNGWRVWNNTEAAQIINKKNNIQTKSGATTWVSTTTTYDQGIYFGSHLYLPAAGGRQSSSGAMSSYTRYYHMYWLDGPAGVRHFLYGANGNFSSGNAVAWDYGFSVRCVAE